VEIPSPVQIATVVQLKRDASGRASAVVEAGPDFRFYHRFLNTKNCDLTFAQSKDHVLEVIDILENEGLTGIVGLVDRDFDALNSVPVPSQNVIVTDCHDLESLIIRSPAFEKILNELGSLDKRANFEKKVGDVLNALLRAGARIGCLRLHSLRNNLGLDFKNLTFSRFVDADVLVVDAEKLLEEVKNKSGKPGLGSTEIIEAVFKLEDASLDPWEVCNGHDLVAILALALRKTFGSKRTKTLTIEDTDTLLRTAYELASFRSTRIYKSLKDWERRNKIQILA